MTSPNSTPANSSSETEGQPSASEPEEERRLSLFDEWVQFLSGPSDPPFSAGTSFSDSRRTLFRLLGFTLGLSGILIGASTVISTKDLLKGGEAILLQSKPALFILVGGVCLAVVYTFFFGGLFFIPKLRCVPITLRQAVFATLLLGLPWLPPLALVVGIATQLSRAAVAGPIKGLIAFVLIALEYVCGLAFMFNFYRGVRALHPDCPWWRVSASIIIPTSFIGGLYLISQIL